jgi:hypothetical protein
VSHPSGVRERLVETGIFDLGLAGFDNFTAVETLLILRVPILGNQLLPFVLARGRVHAGVGTEFAESIPLRTPDWDHPDDQGSHEIWPHRSPLLGLFARPRL